MINWKEFRGRMCYFEVLSLHFSIRTEQNLKKKKINKKNSGQPNWAPLGMTNRPTCSETCTLKVTEDKQFYNTHS
jgi:hypothetical protein